MAAKHLLAPLDFSMFMYCLDSTSLIEAFSLSLLFVSCTYSRAFYPLYGLYASFSIFILSFLYSVTFQAFMDWSSLGLLLRLRSLDLYPLIGQILLLSVVRALCQSILPSAPHLHLRKCSHSFDHSVLMMVFSSNAERKFSGLQLHSLITCKELLSMIFISLLK